MLERLRDRAKIAFALFQSGLGPQLTVDESEFPDDVAILSGRASVVRRSGSESPQAMPMDAFGVTETASPNASPVVAGAAAYNVYGSMGDVMQDLGLEYYNPKHSSSYPF